MGKKVLKFQHPHLIDSSLERSLGRRDRLDRISSLKLCVPSVGNAYINVVQAVKISDKLTQRQRGSPFGS